MNILKFFRKPSLILASSIGFLIFSCTQYDMTRRGFDYALYEAFKESNTHLINFSLDSKLQSDGKNFNLQTSLDLLDRINAAYGSELSVPDNVLKAMTTITNEEDIKNFVVSQGLVNNQQIYDLENFVNNLETYDFDFAMEKFEDEVISRSISPEDLRKYDDFASTLKIINEETPIFVQNSGDTLSKGNISLNNNKTTGPISCLVAYLLWILSLIGFIAGCATVFLCVAAGVTLVAQTITVVTECEGLM
jgi:hypothetical protein